MSAIARRTGALTAAGLLALATSAGAAPGRYGGHTSQKEGGSALLITFDVAGKALTDVNVQADVEQGGGACATTDEGTSYAFTRGSVPIDQSGVFDSELKGPDHEAMKISGAFKDHTAEGSFEISLPASFGTPTTCNSGKVTFTAIAAGGQVPNTEYSGSVGPGYPINFRISANGDAIDDLQVSIEATCQPGAGDEAPVYDFKTLKISSGTFSGSVFEQDGSTISNSIGISGTFFGRTAVGEVSDLSHIKSLPDCTNTEPFTATAK